MGNGTSSQGGIPPHDKRDVGTSVAKEQHDWQAEQAVAPKPEMHSLQETRKPYSGASNAGPSPPTEKDNTRDSAYSSAQAQRRQSLNSPDYRNRKSSVMKDDKTSSVMQDDGSSSTEDERDDSKTRPAVAKTAPEVAVATDREFQF